MTEATFDLPTVWGDHHVLGVRETLTQIDGVEDVRVSAAWAQAQVTFDGEITSPKTIAQALEAAGYPVGAGAPPYAGPTGDRTDSAPLDERTEALSTPHRSPSDDLKEATGTMAVARALARGIATGAAAHAAQVRALAQRLSTADDEPGDDRAPLAALAEKLGVVTASPSAQALHEAVGQAAMGLLGSGPPPALRAAPRARRKTWQAAEIIPGGIDREIAETLAQSALTEEPAPVLIQAMRCALVDGWGSSLLAADLADALYGAPEPTVVAVGPEEAEAVIGFTPGAVIHALGGVHRSSLAPLNEAIAAGRVRGLAAIVGSDPADVARALIEADVLVIATGQAADQIAAQGLMHPHAALESAGPGLRQVCEAVGLPPALHLGMEIETARALPILAAIVATGGLGADLSEVPAVALAPNWAGPTALSIATYSVASGLDVWVGTRNPIAGSDAVAAILSETCPTLVGAGLRFAPNGETLVEEALACIDAKRDALGLPSCSADDWIISGDWRVPDLLALPADARFDAVYGITEETA